MDYRWVNENRQTQHNNLRGLLIVLAAVNTQPHVIDLTLPMRSQFTEE